MQKNKDKASDKRPPGGRATPDGDRQPCDDDPAINSELRDKTKETYYVQKEDEVFILDHSEAKEEVAMGTEIGKEVVDPFTRKSKTARTPPLRRTFSLLDRRPPRDNSDANKDDDRGKRKRINDSPPEVEERERTEALKKPREIKERAKRTEEGKYKEDPLKAKTLKRVTDLIARVDEGVTNLYAIISGSKNTKTEIKEQVEDLVELMKSLTSKDIGSLTESAETRKPKTREIGLQVDLGEKPRLQRKGSLEEVTSLTGCDTVEKWKEIVNKRWKPDVYKCTEIKEGGNILATKDDVIKVILVSKSGDDIANKKVWDRFPELLTTVEEYVILEQTTKLRTGNDVRATQKGDDWVAFQQAPGRSVTNYRKMLECIFSNTAARVCMYTAKKGQGKSQKTTGKEKKERDTYALVVEGTKKEAYTEVLKRVKEKVGGSTTSSKIRGLRSTRDGRLLITMDKDPDAVNRVEEILGELSDSMKVTKAGQREKEIAIHIRGLDALTTKQDIVEALERKIGPTIGKTYRLSELRPNAGDTLAATLVINKGDAGKILEDGVLRVGFVICKVEKRIEMVRCFRCWSYTHRSKDCNKIDRSKLCYKCGEEGHNAKSCSMEEACPVCGVKGHMADTRRCQVFRRALSQAREAARRKGRNSVAKSQPMLEKMSPETSEPGKGPGQESLPNAEQC